MDVIQGVAAPGELDAGSAPQFPNPHGHNIERGPLTLPEIEEPVELRSRVRSGRDFHNGGA